MRRIPVGDEISGRRSLDRLEYPGQTFGQAGAMSAPKVTAFVAKAASAEVQARMIGRPGDLSCGWLLGFTTDLGAHIAHGRAVGCRVLI